jgi:hypothetical protein
MNRTIDEQIFRKSNQSDKTIDLLRFHPSVLSELGHALTDQTCCTLQEKRQMCIEHWWNYDWMGSPACPNAISSATNSGLIASGLSPALLVKEPAEPSLWPPNSGTIKQGRIDHPNTEWLEHSYDLLIMTSTQQHTQMERPTKGKT